MKELEQFLRNKLTRADLDEAMEMIAECSPGANDDDLDPEDVPIQEMTATDEDEEDFWDSHTQCIQDAHDNYRNNDEYEAKKVERDYRKRTGDKAHKPKRAHDMPPPFKGRPMPGGKLHGMDAATRTNVSRIGHDYMGIRPEQYGRRTIDQIAHDAMMEIAAMTPSQRASARRQIAQDSKQQADAIESYYELFPETKRIGHR